MKLADIRKMPGVSDLPLKQAGKFAQALRAESAGDKAQAEKLLAQAIA